MAKAKSNKPGETADTILTEDIQTDAVAEATGGENTDKSEDLPDPQPVEATPNPEDPNSDSPEDVAKATPPAPSQNSRAGDSRQKAKEVCRKLGIKNIIQNDKGEFFTNENLAMLSVGADPKKLETFTFTSQELAD